MKFTSENAKQVLAHLFTGFKTTFNKSFTETETTWDKVATKVNSTSAAENYAWLGKFPKLREWIGDKVVKRLEGHGYTVKNRSFEFPQNLMGWKTFGHVTLKDDGPFERNPHYVRLAYPGHDHKRTGLENEGFFGIGVKAGEEYRFSVWARLPEGASSEKIRIEMVKPNTNAERHAFASEELTIDQKNGRNTRSF